MRFIRRLPIRVRLTLAFAAVMALVLTSTGVFVYFRLRSGLDHTIDEGLRSKAGDVALLIRSEDSGLRRSGRSPLTEQGETFAQVLTVDGKVFDATPEFRSNPLLSSSERRHARRESLLLPRVRGRGLEDPARLFATPVRAQDRRLIVVVGSATDDRDEALKNLVAVLLIGGPAALLLASLGGYGVAAAALRPVEAMRRKAASVSVTKPGERLPVAPAQDEIARLGETLNEMLARQEAAFARERTFVGDASHELRTPLAILRTELELALRGGRSIGELEDAIRSAAEEADRLNQLAEDLLVIARSDQGRLPVQLAHVDATELLESAQRRFSQRAADAGRSVSVVGGPGPDLVADPLRLDQAIGNLVENALRHGEGDVTLAAEAYGSQVELHVRDEGPGFPADFLDDAFERFSRADQARARGGAGLGLSIVLAIAAAHGGKAVARNGPNGGADVWLSLPREPAQPARAGPSVARTGA